MCFIASLVQITVPTCYLFVDVVWRVAIIEIRKVKKIIILIYKATQLVMYRSPFMACKALISYYYSQASKFLTSYIHGSYIAFGCHEKNQYLLFPHSMELFQNLIYIYYEPNFKKSISPHWVQREVEKWNYTAVLLTLECHLTCLGVNGTMPIRKGVYEASSHSITLPPRKQDVENVECSNAWA